MNQMSDKEDIFSTPESESRLDLIKHLIENSELVPLVRGMSGIGKSLLASRLQSGAPDNWVVCLFEADSMMQPERLLAQIARCNGLPDAKDDNNRRLVERFEKLRRRGSIPVLLIDDAQELPPTSLIALLRLYERQVDGAPLVSLVLFGNEQIDLLLSTPQLQVMSPQSIQVIDLPPLTREEADAYMGHLLKNEGLDQRLALDSGRLDRLYRETRGAPGPLASAILQAIGESDGKRENALARLGGSWLRIALPIGVVLLFMLLFQDAINSLFSPGRPVTEEHRVVERVVPPTPAARPVTETDHRENIVTEETEAKSGQPVEKAAPNTLQGADVAVLVTPSEVEVVAQKESMTTQIPEVRQPIEEKPVVDASAEVISKEDTSGLVEVVQPVPEEVSATTGSDEASAGRQAAETASSKPVAQVPAVAKEAATPPPQESTLLKSPEWLRAQAPGSYTVQLLAVENIESLQKVIERHELQDKAFSVKTLRQGRPWYPLLWGQFANRTEAMEATKRLPQDLRKGGAWARPLSSLLQ